MMLFNDQKGWYLTELGGHGVHFLIHPKTIRTQESRENNLVLWKVLMSTVFPFKSQKKKKWRFIFLNVYVLNIQ